MMSFADDIFDFVFSSAVLHFARDEGHRRDTVGEMWRVLRRGGVFFARLASGIGICRGLSIVEASHPGEQGVGGEAAPPASVLRLAYTSTSREF